MVGPAPCDVHSVEDSSDLFAVSVPLELSFPVGRHKRSQQCMVFRGTACTWLACGLLGGVGIGGVRRLPAPKSITLKSGLQLQGLLTRVSSLNENPLIAQPTGNVDVVQDRAGGRRFAAHVCVEQSGAGGRHRVPTRM